MNNMILHSLPFARRDALSLLLTVPVIMPLSVLATTEANTIETTTAATAATAATDSCLSYILESSSLSSGYTLRTISPTTTTTFTCQSFLSLSQL